jgi:hypothetical protein
LFFPNQIPQFFLFFPPCSFPSVNRKITYTTLINVDLGELDIRVDINKLDELGADDLAGSAPLSIEINSGLKHQFLCLFFFVIRQAGAARVRKVRHLRACQRR